MTIADFVADCDVILKRLESPEVRNNSWYVIRGMGVSQTGNAAIVPGWVQDLVAEALEVSNTEMPPVSLAKAKAIDSLENARWLITTLRKWATGLNATPPVATPAPPQVNADAEKASPGLDTLATAMLLKHRDWTDTRIASELECERTSLYKPHMVAFKATRAALEAERDNRLKGTKSKGVADSTVLPPEYE